MERKTKHRILGFLVIAAFGIIMLPFFEGGTSPIPDATIVKAPPFPESASAQAALNPPITLAQTNSSAYNQQPDDTISANSPTAVNAQAISSPQIAVPSHEQANTLQKQDNAKNTVSTVTSTTETNSAITTDKKITQVDNNEIDQVKNLDTEKQTNIAMQKESAEESKDAELDTVAEEEGDENVSQPKQTNVVNKSDTTKNKIVSKRDEATKETIKPVASTSKTSAIKRVTKKTLVAIKRPFVPQIKPFIPEGKTVAIVGAPVDANGLAKLRNAAWVIQIGSFKDKSNALRLVNQLRANGYRAFIQQVSTSFGDGTRVFIGPEPKQNTARALAARLENNMHIRGIVISYKPLAL